MRRPAVSQRALNCFFLCSSPSAFITVRFSQQYCTQVPRNCAVSFPVFRRFEYVDESLLFYHMLKILSRINPKYFVPKTRKRGCRQFLSGFT